MEYPLDSLFDQKRLKRLYRIFMQRFFFASVNLQIMSVKHIQDQQDRKLWGNDISIFQMLHTRKDQCLIAEFLIGFILSCSHEKSMSFPLMSCPQGGNDIFCLSADADSDDQTAFIKNNRVYLHNVAVCNRLNIQPNAHKTQLHFLRDKSGTASSIDIHPWSGHKQFGDTRNLCFVQKRIRLIQKFLISIKF